KDNIEARLSISRYRSRDDIDMDTAQRLANRIDDEVKAAMRPFGYYEPTVTSDLRAVGTGWHYTIRVEPGMPVILEKVEISITAEKSRWQLSMGAGYGTDTQARGTLGWTDTRLNDRGHRLRFELKGSASTRRIDARYDIPIGDPALERFSVELIHKFEQIADL